MNRLDQIDRVMGELAECRASYASGDPLLVLLGEMDWLEELHILLYGVN